MINVAKDLSLCSAVMRYLIQYDIAVLNRCVYTKNTADPFNRIFKHSVDVLWVLGPLTQAPI